MPEWKREGSAPEDRKTLVYRGSSMYPTFRELDVLSYRNDRPLRAGDVIAYSSPDHGRITVHRITRKSGEDIITQGDNCRSPDPDPVSPASVLGRIDTFNRNGTVLTVHGDGPGLAYAIGCHVFCRLRPAIFGIIGPVYRRLVIR